MVWTDSPNKGGLGIVVEDDEHEGGRATFRAYCPALESIGAAQRGGVARTGRIRSATSRPLAEQSCGEFTPAVPVTRTATIPRDISSRSDNVKARFERRRGARWTEGADHA